MESCVLKFVSKTWPNMQCQTGKSHLYKAMWQTLGLQRKKYNIELSQNSFTEQKPYYPLAKRQLGRHDRAYCSPVICVLCFVFTSFGEV